MIRGEALAGGLSACMGSIGESSLAASEIHTQDLISLLRDLEPSQQKRPNDFYVLSFCAYRAVSVVISAVRLHIMKSGVR
jgi:hypothetical protein